MALAASLITMYSQVRVLPGLLEVYIMNRKELIEKLQSNVVQIIFTKKDGSIRVMSCTLDSNIVPPSKPTNRKKNDEILPVWDLQKGAWRTFRLENVKSISIGETTDEYNQ